MGSRARTMASNKRPETSNLSSKPKSKRKPPARTSTISSSAQTTAVGREGVTTDVARKRNAKSAEKPDAPPNAKPRSEQRLSVTLPPWLTRVRVAPLTMRLHTLVVNVRVILEHVQSTPWTSWLDLRSAYS